MYFVNFYDTFVTILFTSRYIFFEEDMSKRENIYLDKIESVQILTSGTDPQGKIMNEELIGEM